MTSLTNPITGPVVNAPSVAAYHQNLSRHLLSLLGNSKRLSADDKGKSKPRAAGSANETSRIEAESSRTKRLSGSSPSQDTPTSPTVLSGSGEGSSTNISSATESSDSPGQLVGTASETDIRRSNGGKRDEDLTCERNEKDRELKVDQRTEDDTDEGNADGAEVVLDETDLTARPGMTSIFTPLLREKQTIDPPSACQYITPHAPTSSVTVADRVPPHQRLPLRRSSDPARRSTITMSSPCPAPEYTDVYEPRESELSEEAQRLAWLTSRKADWQRIPDGFQLNLDLATAGRSRRGSGLENEGRRRQSAGAKMEGEVAMDEQMKGLDLSRRDEQDHDATVRQRGTGGGAPQWQDVAGLAVRMGLVGGEPWATRRASGVSMGTSHGQPESLGNEEQSLGVPEDNMSRYGSKTSLPVSVGQAVSMTNPGLASSSSSLPQDKMPAAPEEGSAPAPISPSDNPAPVARPDSLAQPAGSADLYADAQNDYEMRRQQRLQRKHAELSRAISLWASRVTEETGEDWGRVEVIVDIEPTPPSPGPGPSSLGYAYGSTPNQPSVDLPSASSSSRSTTPTLSLPALPYHALPPPGPAAVSRQLHRPLHIIPPTPDAERTGKTYFAPLIANSPPVPTSTSAAAAAPVRLGTGGVVYPSARQHVRKSVALKPRGASSAATPLPLDIALRLRALEALVGEAPPEIARRASMPGIRNGGALGLEGMGESRFGQSGGGGGSRASSARGGHRRVKEQN